MSSHLSPRSRRGGAGAPGTNSPQMRRLNRSLILRTLLLDGPMPRLRLAEVTGLTQPTISRITDDLLRAGFLEEKPTPRQERDTPGRTPGLVGIDPDGGHVLTLHLGGSIARLTVADLRGRTRPIEQMPLRAGDPEPQLRALCRRLLARAGEEGIPADRVRGIGVGSSGVVDPAGTIVSHPWLRWEQVPVRAILEDESGLPVATDSTVRAIANAEAWFGARRHVEPLAVVLVGNVVAVAVVVHRSALLGMNLTEGQVGHLSVGGTRRCACGRVGCLEAEVRTETLLERAAALGVEVREPTPEAIVERARAGDQAARGLLEERGRLLAEAVIVLDAVANPGHILFVGSSFNGGDDLQLQLIREAVAGRHVLPGVRGAPSLGVGTFGPASSVVGAASLALRTFFEDVPASRPGG